MSTKHTARLGNSVYEAEDTLSPGVVKITRTNPADAKPVEFFIPRELILTYAVNLIKERLSSSLLKELLK